MEITTQRSVKHEMEIETTAQRSAKHGMEIETTAQRSAKHGMEIETSAQHSIRHCMAMLAPFAASAPEKREGQEQFYRLMYSIYEGMYAEPEAWFVFPAPYEEYTTKAKVRGGSAGCAAGRRL